MHTSQWRALIRRLRAAFPVQGRVTVLRRPVRCDCGLTTFDGTDYRVRINSRQSMQGQVDALLHEWAHVCAIEEAYRHEGAWGALYAAIYSAWENGFAAKGEIEN